MKCAQLNLREGFSACVRPSVICPPCFWREPPRWRLRLPRTRPPTADNGAKIDQIQQQIDELNAQVSDLKRSQSSQYTDVSAQVNKPADVAVSLKNGRPSFKTADGEFHRRHPRAGAVRLRVLRRQPRAGRHRSLQRQQFPPRPYRRAGHAVQGLVLSVPVRPGRLRQRGASIASAYIQYDGFGPIHWKIGAYPTPESFDDTTAASDLLFLERAQPTDLARSIAGSDGRDGTTIFAYGDDYYAAASYTGDLVQDTATFDEQQALVGRVAWRAYHDGNSNFAIGADSTYEFKIAETAAGPHSPSAIRLRERPELNVDDNSIRLIDTNTIDADKLLEWGVEAAGNWDNFYGQGGYFHFDVTRRASALPDPSFDGWYAQASWVITGESKPYNTATGSYGLPKPDHAFSFDKPGSGAWELAGRYSVLDLDTMPVLRVMSPLSAVSAAASRRSGRQG